MSLLDKIKLLYQQYINNPSYVCKVCGNPYDDKFYIIILQKMGKTLTNESRKNVINPKYAKFRANCLKVILIFNVNDPERQIENIESNYYYPTLYQKGKEVHADKFDTNLGNICSNGIHYYRTIDAAFFCKYLPGHVRPCPYNFKGDWIFYDDDGQVFQVVEYL
jgi:hypothetical protein